MSVAIYALVDPSDGRIRYVGKTTGSLTKRLAGHLNDVKRGRVYIPRYRWIASLLAQGIVPTIVALDQVDDSIWREAERGWIARLRSEGLDLLNATAGGDGLSAYRHRDDTKRKQSASALTRYVDAGERRRTSDAVRAALNRPDVKAKLAEAARSFSDEHKAKFREAGTRYAQTVGRGKTSARFKGRQWSEESRKKLSASRLGQKRSPESIAKTVAGLTGRKLTAEHRANISAGCRRNRDVTA